MKPRNSRNLSSILFLTLSLPAMADQNWDGGSLANGNWGDYLNWNGTLPANVPGSTSVTTDTGLAIFNAAIVNTWGNSALNPVVIDSTTQNLGGIIFQTNTGSYFVGSTGGNTLRLTTQTTEQDRAKIQIQGNLSGTNVVETVNAPLALYGPNNGIYAFTNNSANGAGVGAGTLNIGGSITSASAVSVTTLYLNGSNTNANTVSGNITSGLTTNFGLNKSGAGTWILSGTNSYNGDRIVKAGTLILTGANGGTSRTTIGDNYNGATPTNAHGIATLQLSGANGALTGVNATPITLINTASLVLDNTTAAGGNNNARIADTQGILFNGGSVIFKGADAAATPTTETIGAITFGVTVSNSFLNRNPLISVLYGGTNSATLTAASLTRSYVGIPTMLVNGSNLGMDSATTTSVGRFILTSAPTLVGTSNAAATGIDALVKNTKIATGLVGEATTTIGGLGSATGTANTFLTYHATTGLRPLNPTDEFTNNAITAGNNTYITSATSATATAAINSLVINGADLSINDGQTLTDTSGMILFASSHKIKPTGTTGTLAFGTTEAQITINSGVTAQINAPITGTGGVTLSGLGTMQVTGSTAYSSLAGNAKLNLSAGSTLTTGSNNASTTYNGTFSGSGTLTKTGSGTLSIGSEVSGSSANDDFLFSGDININGGALKPVNFGDVFTKSKVTINGGTLNLDGNMAVFSLFGTSGTLTGASPSGGAGLFVSYTGTDPAAGFTGTVSGTSAVSIKAAGSGDLTFGALGGSGTLTNVGSGKITAISTAASNGAGVLTPFAQIKLTGNTGVVNSGNGVTALYGGVLTLAPSGSGANVLVTGQGLNGTFRVRIAGGGTLQLDKGSNTSMEYRVGLSSNTNADFLAFVSNGSGPGSLILDPVGGAATLGTTAKFTILNSTTGKVLSNGIVPIPMVVVDNDGTRKGDFVTYNGTGIAGDVGYQQATYTHNDTFTGSTNVSVVKNTTAKVISADTSAFALRNDSTISIDVTKTLTLGAPPATNANANATQSPNTGLILNGGTISGAGTLAFGTTAAAIYTSDAGGTISAKMTGSGGTNAGYGAYSGYTPASVIKFGAGTLTLSGANTYTGATVINAGAVDVGTITTGDALSGSTGNLTFGGGVIQGNGTFDRGLGGGGNQVTWNGVNLTNSQQSGGFAAKGGSLTVAIGGTGAPSALTWGLSPQVSHFITEVGVVGAPGGQSGILMFGSNTSDSQVDFKNSIDLGNQVAANGTVASPLYYRIIHVAQGTGADSAKISGIISSTVVHGLIKDGPGKLILSAPNTYTGDTAVTEGTLLLTNTTGSGTGTGAVTVNSGATLGGSGTISGAVAVSSGGHYAPGNSISSTFGSGALTLASGSFTDIELGTAGASHAAPGISDRTTVSGALVLGGTLTVINNAGANGDGSIGGGSYKIFTQTGPPTGSFSSIINASGYHAKVDTATSGSVFLDNYAIATTGTIAAVNLGKARVGGSFSGSGALSVTNATAANNGYTEGLNATQGAVTGGVIAGGSNVSNLAGASSSTNLSVGFSTATSGAKSGTSTINLASSGTNSGYADTSLGSQTVGVTGSVYDYADAVFSKTAGDGTFTAVSSTSFTLDFGAGLALSTNYTATINLANGTFFNAFQDNLGGSYTSGGAGEFTNTATMFSNLVSNGNNSFTITFNTGSSGTFTGTLDFSGLSQQSGLTDAGLSNINIAFTGTAVPEPNVAVLLGSLGAFILLRRRR